MFERHTPRLPLRTHKLSAQLDLNHLRLRLQRLHLLPHWRHLQQQPHASASSPSPTSPSSAKSPPSSPIAPIFSPSTSPPTPSSAQSPLTLNPSSISSSSTSPPTALTAPYHPSSPITYAYLNVIDLHSNLLTERKWGEEEKKERGEEVRKEKKRKEKEERKGSKKEGRMRRQYRESACVQGAEVMRRVCRGWRCVPAQVEASYGARRRKEVLRASGVNGEGRCKVLRRLW